MNDPFRSFGNSPIDKITDHPDFDLLVAIRDAISQLHPAVENIINGEKDISGAKAVIAVIHNSGQKYRARVTDALRELRKEPGHEHDGLQSTCVIDGKVWSSAI